MLSSLKGMAATLTAAADRATLPKVHGQKKSCDACVSRKHKCDGALPTCGFCASRGSECRYSLRRLHRPRGYYTLTDEEKEEQSRAKVVEKLASKHGHGKDDGRELQQGQQGFLAVGWKRARLSPSGATGLVGMKENAFLGSFFSCLGFLPLTHERLIRGTMMEIMLSSPSGPEIDQILRDSHLAQAEKASGAWGTGGALGEGDPASACALWCTIAIGALVQGQPPENAAPYVHLAWTSLSRCFDTVTVESGRAFLMMAYLYNFMRDDHKFCRYLEFARKVVDRLPDQTVQKQEIDDLLMMGNDTRIFHTAAMEPSELDAFCTDNGPALEVPDVVRKDDLCRLLLQADSRMMKAFLRDHVAQAVVILEQGKRHTSSGGGIGTNPWRSRAGDEKSDGLQEITRNRTHPDGGEESYFSGMSISTDGISLGSTTIADEASPSRPGDETWKCSEEARNVFSRLGKAADAPEIRAGVGSLLYNFILGYFDMVTGSTELGAGFERVKHCAGIISRYPGICRFSTWRHVSHCLLSFLSKLGDVEVFEVLRQAYNSVSEDDAPDAPPHAEWTMVGFCDHIFCRSMGHLENDMDRPAAGHEEEQRWPSQESHWQHDTNGSNCWESPASVPSSTTVTSDQAFPTHEWTDVMPPGLGDERNFPARQCQQMAPVEGCSGAGIHPMAFVNPAGRAHGGGTSISTGEHGQAHRGWRPAPAPGATYTSVTHEGCGALWPCPSSMAIASSEGGVDPNALNVVGRKVVNAAKGNEQECHGTSSSSTSDMSGPEDGRYGSVDRYPAIFTGR